MVKELLKTAEQAATAAGALLRKLWETPRELTSKGYRDIVTDADYAAQNLIVETIRQQFPDHGFMTEEDATDLPTDGEMIWIIDPVDGTSNYSRQIPNFTVSIAAAKPNGAFLDIQAGAIFDPMRQETISAGRGLGAKVNRHPCFTSQARTPIESIFALDWSKDQLLRQETLNILGVIAHEVKTVRAIGTAALALSWIGSGRLDGYMSLSLYPWDIAAAMVIVQEAGGSITDLHGEPRHQLPWEPNQIDVLVSNGHLHPKLLEYVEIGQAVSRQEAPAE